MTIMEFVGCASTAYGPTAGLFAFTIMKDPIRIIILIASAFFWLLSLLLSSIIWVCIPSESALFLGVIFSVILQEIFRYLLYIVLQKVEKGLKKVYIPNTNTEITNNRHILAYVAGLGFGVMSGAFSLANVLAEVIGPGTMKSEGGSEYFCLVSSIFTIIFTLLHTLWSVIFFNSIENKNYALLSWVVGSHLAVSCLTLLNQQSMYLATLLPGCITLVITLYLAFRVWGGSCHRGLCRHQNIVPNLN
ncbi:hypothetical protein AAG570_009445 [Ranatra chinensis]|uniref:Gamma-secretase subunit Aph-1 n=1 Tax=Ranatra chinensis TaxID=642074 RepID=A0ABD0YR87_9HEMI